MGDKLKEYQVIDVLCGGTFYKVRHKVTSNIFAWKAYNCSAYSDDQIQTLVNEVKTISKVTSKTLLRYYDTILHAPSRTLYFVLEYYLWQSVEELLESCKATDKYITESFLWHLLHELARVCKAVEDLSVVVLQKCITCASIFVADSGELRVNCFDLKPVTEHTDLMRQCGDVLHALCYRSGAIRHKIKEFHYSDDLRDIIAFLRDERDVNLRPDALLYHPTLLTNLESNPRHRCLNEILISVDQSYALSEVNKCDSEKVVELNRKVEPLPRTVFNVTDSPLYCNIKPVLDVSRVAEAVSSPSTPMSPTLAALALELPGFVPRCRRPYTQALDKLNCAQKVSEETFSQQWMSRLVALRQREESLNKRERELIAKEIVNSPCSKIVPVDSLLVLSSESASNGITLPPMITQAKEDKECWRRRRPRTSSVRARGRRRTFAYEDLDSSLSADAGDGSIVITATKFTKENMPRRNIFPEVSTKKVHFTASNPFVESDDSVTLTFYDLDNVDSESYQLPKQEISEDITKFKYLDLKRSEKRASMHWGHSSPSKQQKTSKHVLDDITNSSGLRKTPSKSSLTSRGSNTSRQSMFCRSQWSMESSSTKVSEGSISERTRSAMRQGLTQTPIAPPDKKSKSRKSLLSFKTPFKFMTSTKI